LNVDAHGLDEMDNKILNTIIDKFKGGPVGLSTLATAVSESDEIEEVYEPFFNQRGFYHAHATRKKLQIRHISI
jgi:Holliday junction DNA helicase RuvB